MMSWAAGLIAADRGLTQNDEGDALVYLEESIRSSYRIHAEMLLTPRRDTIADADTVGRHAQLSPLAGQAHRA